GPNRAADLRGLSRPGPWQPPNSMSANYAGGCKRFFRYTDLMQLREHANAAESVIARFGGQTALANLLGKRQSTIEHWASTGRIPAQWHGPLMSLARQKGIVLEARDFTEHQPHEIAPAEGKLG